MAMTAQLAISRLSRNGGLAKAQKRGVDPNALVEYKQYLPAYVACKAFNVARAQTKTGIFRSWIRDVI